MGLFSGLVGWFKVSAAPKKEEEVSECCANGQCVCGESSSIEDENVFSAPIELINPTSGGPGSASSTAKPGMDTTSSTSDDVTNLTTFDDVTSTITTTGASSTSDDINPIQELFEEPSEEEKSIQLEFDLSDTVEEKASVHVVTDTTSSPPKVSTKNKIQKSKSKRGKKRKK